MAFGGRPSQNDRGENLIPYGKQWIGREDISAVRRTLSSGWITQGPKVLEFEQAFAAYCGAKYAVAVSSGTAGLHLAALAGGFGPDDEAVTSALSFVATSNCLLYAGATPRFVDIEEKTLGLDPVKAVRAVGRRTRGVIKVHFAGEPCLAGGASFFSKKKNFVVIEDACHALGAEIRAGSAWKKIGSGYGADLSVFSFHPVKHITTGEGGMVTTSRRDFYEKLLLLRSHGIERDPKKWSARENIGNPWYYEMTELGFNYRITDIQCALGLEQLKKLPGFVARRREIASEYLRDLSGIDNLRLPGTNEGNRSSYHLFIVRINYQDLGKDRRQVMETLRLRGIGTQVHYIPIPRQPFYRRHLKTKPSDYPVCEAYYREALSLPIYPAMKRADTDKVIREVKNLFRKKNVA